MRHYNNLACWIQSITMSITFCHTGKEMKEKGLEKTDLQCAATSLAIIGMRVQDNNTRSLRVQSSDGQRLCHALITRVAEWCAMSADWINLCYKALINFSPSTRVTVSSTWQRVTEGFSYHMPMTMSLLHASRQRGIIVTSHRAGVPCVRDATRRQTSDPLQALSSSLFIALSLKVNRLACQRRVFTVVCSREVKHSFIYDLYTLCQHSYKVWQEVWHCKGCLNVSCELHMPSHLKWSPLQWGWDHGSCHHISADCKSQEVQQYVIEGKEEDQRGKKRTCKTYSKHDIDMMLFRRENLLAE